MYYYYGSLKNTSFILSTYAVMANYSIKGVPRRIVAGHIDGLATRLINIST